MSENKIISNFGIVQDQITSVKTQLGDTIVPVIDRVNDNELSQKQEFEKAMSSLAGLGERLQKSVNPIIQRCGTIKNNVETYRIELGQNRIQHDKC